MRHLTEFPTEKAAQALADYLEVNDIEADVRHDDPFEVWVLDDDDVDSARDLLESYDADTDHAAAAKKKRDKRRAKARPVAQVQHTGGAGHSAGPVTLALLGASILVALASGLGEASTDIVRKLLVVPVFEQVLPGGYSQTMAPVALVWSEPWRLVTPMLIHFGIFHLAFNMLWLHRFGSQIESVHGARRFVMLVVVASALGSIAQFHMSGPLFGGMSGVNYALFAFVWMQARYGKSGYEIESRDTVLLMGWLVLCATGLVGPVANACHAVGLAVGLLAGLPVFVHYNRTHEVQRGFAKGSWADLNVTGWRRFERLYVQPYVPLWFMAVALAILLID